MTAACPTLSCAPTTQATPPTTIAPSTRRTDGGPELTWRTPGRVGPTTPPGPDHRPTHHRDQAYLDERLDDPLQQADGQCERNGPQPESHRPPSRRTRVDDPRRVLAALDLVKLLLQIIGEGDCFPYWKRIRRFPEWQVMEAIETRRLVEACQTTTSAAAIRAIDDLRHPAVGTPQLPHMPQRVCPRSQVSVMLWPMKYERLWELTLRVPEPLDHRCPGGARSIQVALVDSDGSTRSVEILMTRDEWDQMVTIPWGDFDLAAQEVRKAVLGLRDDERFLIFRDYERLVQSVTPTLPVAPGRSKRSRSSPGVIGRLRSLGRDGPGRKRGRRASPADGLRRCQLPVARSRA